MRQSTEAELSPKAPPRRLRRGQLVALLLATAAFRMTQNMAVTTLSLLAHEVVHLGAGAIGTLGAISGTVVALVTLFLSRHVPHHRSALSAAAGMGGLAVALLVLAAAPSYGVLVAGAILLGAAGGIAMPALLNAIVSVAGPERERVIAIYTVTLSLSLAAGPLLETLVLSLSHQAVRLPFVVFAAFPFLGAGLALLAYEKRRGGAENPAAAAPEQDEVELLESSELAVGLSTDEIAAVEIDHRREKEKAPRPPRSWRSGLLSSRAGQLALVTQILYGVPFAGVTVFGALVARVGFGFSPAKVQLGFTVFFACSFVARAGVAWRAPISRKHALLTISALLTIAGLLLLGLGGGDWALFLAMALLGIPHGLTFPLALALVAEGTPVEELPRANAGVLGSANVTSVVVPLILGGIIPAVGYQAMTLVMLAPVVALTVVHLRLGERRAG